MSAYPITEEELIGYTWLNLARKEWGKYAWCGPGTWATLYQASLEALEVGALGEFNWITPKPFTVRILMNPFCQEGRIYLAHAGTEYLAYVTL